MPDQNARANFQEFAYRMQHGPYMLPIHPNDRRLRARALRSLYMLERINDRNLTPAQFARAFRAHKRAARRYSLTLLRRRTYSYLADVARRLLSRTT